MGDVITILLSQEAHRQLSIFKARHLHRSFSDAVLDAIVRAEHETRTTVEGESHPADHAEL